MASQKADNSSPSKSSVVAEGTKAGENSSTPGKLSSLANTRPGARPSSLSALAQQSKAKSGSSSLQRLASRSQAGGGQEPKSISPKLSNDADVANSTSALAKLALKHQTKPPLNGLAALATASRKSPSSLAASALPPSKPTDHGIETLPPTATKSQPPSEISTEDKHIPSTTVENDKQFDRPSNTVQATNEMPKENREELPLGYLDHPLCAPPSSVAEFLFTPLNSKFERLEMSQLNISTASKSLNATIYQNIMPSSKNVRAFNFDAPSPDDTVRNAQSRRKGVLNKGST